MQVSVIIPTYNSARFLAEAIDSVLAQSFKDFEIVVIDDGSTDETKALMLRYGPPVRYIYQENSGVAEARNRGIKESRGRYVAFLDADDTWFPNKLERQVGSLENPDNKDSCRICYSAFAVVDSDLSPLFENRSQRRASALEDLLLRGNIVGSICTVLAERSLFSTAGGFDRALSQCADWDMWVRLAAHTEFLYIDEPLVTDRHHGAMMSKNAALLESDSLLVLKKGFEMTGLEQSLRARRRQAFARNYMVVAGTYFHARRYRDFLRCAARSLAMDMRQGAYLMAFPLRLASRFRAHRFMERA
jgi:glycosyltransferase involved in cell wall biosynthesis